MHHWEYQVSEVVGDDYVALHEDLRRRAEAGWELVNGSTCAYGTGQYGMTVNVAYTMFWRRLSSKESGQ